VISCSLSKSERVEGDWGQKLRPKFALLDPPVKFNGGKGGRANCLSKLYEFTLYTSDGAQLIHLRNYSMGVKKNKKLSYHRDSRSNITLLYGVNYYILQGTLIC